MIILNKGDILVSKSNIYIVYDPMTVLVKDRLGNFKLTMTRDIIKDISYHCTFSKELPWKKKKKLNYMLSLLGTGQINFSLKERLNQIRAVNKFFKEYVGIEIITDGHLYNINNVINSPALTYREMKEASYV